MCKKYKNTPKGYLVLVCISLVETVSCLWMKQMRVCFVRQKEKFVMIRWVGFTPRILVYLSLDLRPGLAWSLSEFPGLNKHSYNKDSLFSTLMWLLPSLKSSNTHFFYVSNSDWPALTLSLCSLSVTQISPSGEISGTRIANEIS